MSVDQDFELYYIHLLLDVQRIQHFQIFNVKFEIINNYNIIIFSLYGSTMRVNININLISRAKHEKKKINWWFDSIPV